MLVTLGILILEVAIEPECFKPVRVHHVNNSSKMECKSSADRVRYFYPVTEYLVDKSQCQQNIKILLSTSPIVDGSIIRQGSQRETLFADLLEDVPTRSLLCHRVSCWQVSPDTLNRNYEAHVLFPHHYIIAEDKLKLSFTTREPSLLRSASRASRHHIMTTSSRPVDSD